MSFNLFTFLLVFNSVVIFASLFPAFDEIFLLLLLPVTFLLLRETHTTHPLEERKEAKITTELKTRRNVNKLNDIE